MRVIEQTDYSDEPVVVLKNTEFKHCRFVYSGDEPAEPWMIEDKVTEIRFTGCLFANCILPKQAVMGELSPHPEWKCW